MRLRNVLIVVEDVERSARFYQELFGLDRVLDNEGNMILTEGLVLQDRKIWQDFIGREVVPRSNLSELYFEEQDLEKFVEKLERLYPRVTYVNRLMTHAWGQQVVRFYDPDGNLIEVGTPMEEEPEQICRIRDMERILDKANQLLDAWEQNRDREAEVNLRDFQPRIRELEAYYSGPLWKKDLAEDEAGNLPADLKRGVLSQDGIYDMLERNAEIMKNNEISD